MAKYSSYSNWASKAQLPNPVIPYAAPPDDRHLNPEHQPEYESMAPLWLQDTSVPSLPVDIVNVHELPPLYAPGGPIDTTPRSHGYGAGTGHGLSEEEAREIALFWGEQDLGAVAADDYVTPPDVVGSYNAIQQDRPDHDQASPETVDLRWNTGVGSPHDPDALHGRLVPNRARWYDRILPFFRYEPDYGPKYVKTAKTTMEMPAQHINQFTSPFAQNTTISTKDGFVLPEIRRIPTNWQDAFITDGTTEATSLGITPWGL